MNKSTIQNCISTKKDKLLDVAVGEMFMPQKAFQIAIDDYFLGLPSDEYNFDDNLEEYFKLNVLTYGRWNEHQTYSPYMTEVLKELYEVHHKQYYKYIKEYVYKVCDYIYKNGGGFENSGFDTFDEWSLYLSEDMDNTTGHLQWNWKCKEEPKSLKVDLKKYDEWCNFEEKKTKQKV